MRCASVRRNGSTCSTPLTWMPAAPTSVSELSRRVLRTASSAAIQPPRPQPTRSTLGEIERVENIEIEIGEVRDGVEPVGRIGRPVSRDARARSRRAARPAPSCWATTAPESLAPCSVSSGRPAPRRRTTMLQPRIGIVEGVGSFIRTLDGKTGNDANSLILQLRTINARAGVRSCGRRDKGRALSDPSLHPPPRPPRIAPIGSFRRSR